MKQRPTRFRALILIGIAFALVAAACTSSDSADDSLVWLVWNRPIQTTSSPRERFFVSRGTMKGTGLVL